MTPDQRRIYDKFEASRHHLQAALDRGHGEMALTDVLDRLLDGDLQLWSSPEYAAVTEVINYPQKRVVLVHLAGGSMEGVVGDEGDLVKFAQAVGATGIKIIGRRGWVKALADRGYHESSVSLFKEVPHGRRK